MLLAFSPVVANAALPTRFDFLISLFDLNEAGFAYHRHCLGANKPINAQFSNTLEFIEGELLIEALKNNPKASPASIKTKISERRYNLQYKLDSANIKKGCHSPASLQAREHYQNFSTYKKSKIRTIIDGQTAK